MDIRDVSRRVDFLREIDRLKSVVRQSPLLDKSRKENSAEHSWHLAMYALVLADYAVGAIDILRVLKMLLLHDIVEVDVGDTPIHGASSGNQSELEQQAAQRIFGLLPEASGQEFLEIWQEFEEGKSVDAQFAKALDRFQPLLINVFTQGGTWSESRVGYEQVLERYGPVIQRGAPALWEIARDWVESHFKK
jgi:putative hydrolase of HD superfamily